MALVLRLMKAPATLLLTTALLSSLCIIGCGQPDSGDGGDGGEAPAASETEAGSGADSESTEDATE